MKNKELDAIEVAMSPHDWVPDSGARRPIFCCSKCGLHTFYMESLVDSPCVVYDESRDLALILGHE